MNKQTDNINSSNAALPNKGNQTPSRAITDTMPTIQILGKRSAEVSPGRVLKECNGQPGNY